jgi:hypothetical protein
MDNIRWLVQGDWKGLAWLGGVGALVLQVVLFGAAPVLVWVLAPRVARLSEKRVVLARLPSELSRNTIMLLAIATVGVVFASLGLMRVIGAGAQFLSFLALSQGVGGAGEVALSRLIGDGVAALGMVVVGVGLMMGPRAVIGLVDRLRRVGLERAGERSSENGRDEGAE